MKNGSTISNFLLLNPFIKCLFEWLILIGTGSLGLIFSWYNFSIFPASNVLGGILILFAFLFHFWAEKDHKQAHEQTENIVNIVNTGVYSKIRHPLYLSLIVLNIGIALSFGVLITLIIALLTVVHWVATTYKEEQILQIRFQDEYTLYKTSVKWRMVPGVF
jgi:protein-S-isoprenylcysteine O-methyltransferase Ste14